MPKRASNSVITVCRRTLLFGALLGLLSVTGCWRSSEQLASDKLRSLGCDVRFRPNGESLAPFWVEAPPAPLTAEFLDCLGKLPSVETLIVARTEFRDGDVNRLPVLPTLKMLDLSDNRLSDAAIAQLLRLRGIETLILDGNALTDAAVADLIQFRSLRALSLQRTQISSEGVDRIIKALPTCIISVEKTELINTLKAPREIR